MSKLSLLLMAPDEFMVSGKAWVEAVSSVLDMLIAKIGVLSLAAIALYQNVKARAAIKEVKARQDRQANLINNVALAATAPSTVPQPVVLEQPEGKPVPVREV